MIPHVRSSCKATRNLQSQMRKVSSRLADSGHTSLLKDLYNQLPIQERLSYRKLGNLFDENQAPGTRRQKRSSTVKLDRSLLDTTDSKIEEAKIERKTSRKLTCQLPKGSLNPRADDFTDIMADRYFICDEPRALLDPGLDTMNLVDLTDQRIDKGFPFSLYISGLKTANDATQLQQNHISAILSLGKGNDPTHCSSVRYLNLPFESSTTSIKPIFNASIRFIRAHLQTGNVLVSCYHGKSRSCSVVVAFLVKQFRIELPDALTRVREARGPLEISSLVMSELEAFAVKTLS